MSIKYKIYLYTILINTVLFYDTIKTSKLHEYIFTGYLDTLNHIPLFVKNII